MKWKIIILSEIAILGILSALLLTVSKKPQGTTSYTTPAVLVSSETYDSCLTKSEKEYTAAKIRYPSSRDRYGNMIYHLSDAQWDVINKKRAKQYEACFHRYN